MNRSVINKMILARRLFALAGDNFNSSNDLALAVGVNLLQDSVEIYLLGISEFLNAGIQSKTAFDQYFELINSKISPKELPFRQRLIALNKLRVNSKHHGLVPAKAETEGLLVTVREFFEENTKSIFGKPFVAISLVDILRDGEPKELIREAEAAFGNEDYAKCLIDCRKAIFVSIESRYDVAPFGGTTEPNPLGLALLMSGVPAYARDRQYVEKNVGDATDYVVFDHNGLEMRLMKEGIDSVSFWNIWRLTPAVYRDSVNKIWVVKTEFSKLENEGIQQRAEYVLDTTIDVLIAADQRYAAARTPDYRKYYIDLTRDEVSIYKKADRNSELVMTTPVGLTRLYVDFNVPALHGDGTYWHVAHLDEKLWISGYIDGEFVKD